MRISKVFISLATVGATGGIGAGGYLLLSKSVQEVSGKLVFYLEENTATPKSFSVKASLSEDNNDASSDKKIIFKIESFIDKTKAQTYLDSFSLTLSEGEDSKFKEKLKEHLETETNKKLFTDSFGEEIYTNLISILKTNVS